MPETAKKLLKKKDTPYPFSQALNRTIQLWNQLLEDALGAVSC
jgi:hypothetical protein